jgi:hypothetical protein
MGRFREHLTYANVGVTICLFLILGGGAYAAAKLGKDTVKSKQIKNGAVQAQDIADGAISVEKLADGSVTAAKIDGGSVTGGKIADGSVTGAKVADDSLIGNDINESTLFGIDAAKVNGLEVKKVDYQAAIPATPRRSSYIPTSSALTRPVRR